MAGQVFFVGVVVTVAILLGRLLAARIGVPDAAAYVVIGVAAGLLPGMEHVRLSPDVVLLLFLPPLIYYAAFFSDPREIARHLGPVVGQSVGLVLATAAACASVVVVVFPDIGWAAALAFGAAIAPPDPVAATSVLQRVGAPRRLITVLEGEGLVNDGAALTLFAAAIGSVGAAMSVGQVGVALLVQVGGGVGFGLVVGVGITWIRTRIRDTPSQVVLSLATPYLTFVPAQLAHSSGVLATVSAAVWLGTRGRGLIAPASRLSTETFWRVLNTVLVALLFVLLGIQVPTIMAAMRGYPPVLLLVTAGAVVVVAVVVRLGWVLAATPMLGLLPWREGVAASLSVRERVALGWCGPRGAVSLAVALSIPLTTVSGAPFPRRDLLLFLTVVVVLATLVGQVVSLPAVFALLQLRRGERERTETLRARRAMADASLCELDATDARGEPNPGAEALRQVVALRRDRLLTQLNAESDSPRAGNVQSDDREVRLSLLKIERQTLRDLHDQGDISKTTLVDISQELDLDEAQLRAKD